MLCEVTRHSAVTAEHLGDDVNDGDSFVPKQSAFPLPDRHFRTTQPRFIAKRNRLLRATALPLFVALRAINVMQFLFPFET